MAMRLRAIPARGRRQIACSSTWIPISPPRTCSTTAWPTFQFHAGSGTHRSLRMTEGALANALGHDVSHQSAYQPQQAIAPAAVRDVAQAQERDLGPNIGVGLGM